MNETNTPCKNCNSYTLCKMVERFPWAVRWKLRSPVRRCTKQSIKDALNSIQLEGKVVLEVGCGNWVYIKKSVERKKGKWIGSDIVKTAITDNLICDNTLPFEDGEFDYVISAQAMEHMDDLPSMMKEVYRVLKPGGQFFANAPVHLHGSKVFCDGDFAGLSAILSPIFDNTAFRFYRKDRSDLSPSRMNLDYPSGWIAKKYKYTSDKDTYARLSASEEKKLLEFEQDHYGFKDAYLIDIRCGKA